MRVRVFCCVRAEEEEEEEGKERGNRKKRIRVNSQKRKGKNDVCYQVTETTSQSTAERISGLL